MFTWQLPNQLLTIDRRPQLMGIVNVTPDSFSDGGHFLSPEAAIAQALSLVEQGANILDVGGESTRPGATPIPAEEELRRVLPVIRALAQQTTVPISIDTSKAMVAQQAMDAGAAIINDVTGLGGDPQMLPVAQATRAGLVVMHSQGTPRTMQVNPQYEDVVAEVRDYLEERLAAMGDAGIEASSVAIDPGIGFGKRLDHNLDLLAHLPALLPLGRPICLGVSRKGFINRVLGQTGWVEQGMGGTLGVLLHALGQGTLQIARVHDVANARAAIELFLALEQRNVS